ncbi:MAG: B12-binding domain-containing radical SAM protein [bacterium]|nr:B12-binding domain-containing radical SAM protein [bacterium]
MKIALVYPDYSTSTHLATPAEYGFYSEGVSSVSAALKHAGHQVELIHLTMVPTREYFEGELSRISPDVLAFSTRTTIFDEVTRLAGYAKKSFGLPVVVGGVHPTIAPELVAVAPEVDVTCVGEGELPFVELCDAMDEGRDCADIDNLWVRRNGDVIRNPTRPMLEDIDILPFPDYDIYDKNTLYSVAVNTGPVMLSRGCPYMCTYCCNHAMKEAYPNKKHYARYRSPKNSIDYLKNLLKNLPDIKYINFLDNILPLYEDWFDEFIELYKAEIKLPYACRHRHNLVKYDDLVKLKETGCYLIHFGLESGNSEIRKKVLNRQESYEQIIRAYQWCHDVGISTLTYNMVGLPGENKDKFLDTVKLNARVRPNRMVLSVFYPYPHTALHDIAERSGIMAEHFDYEVESYLDQPEFPVAQVQFCHRYFRFATRWYMLTYRLGAVGKLLRYLSDVIYTSSLLPHKLLNVIAGIVSRAFEGFKLFVRRRLPGIYIWLRDKVVRRR